MGTSVALVMDEKCNIKCEHCCFSSSPQSTEHLTDEKILQIVDEAAADSSVTTMGISGGEALLRKQVVLESIRRLHRSHTFSTLTSNGYWGHTPRSALRTVSELKGAGLTKLTISYDSFHEKFIPPERIKNVFDACRSVQLSCQLNVAYSNSVDPALILDQLEGALDGVKVVTFPVQPVGSAANFPEEDFIRNEQNLDSLRCPGFEPTFLFDGRVLPCCSPAVIDTCLTLGQSSAMNVSDAQSAIEHNALLAGIRTKGFGWLSDTYREAGVKTLPLTDGFVDACDACRQMTADPAALRAISGQVIKSMRGDGDNSSEGLTQR